MWSDQQSSIINPESAIRSSHWKAGELRLMIVD
jgi:hypothetical protein